MKQTSLEHNSAPHHIVPVRVYLNVLGILTVLTLITVGAALIDFGHTWINITIALLIASIKATLVVLYFMHVKYSGKIVSTIMIIGVAFFVLLLVGVLQDYWTRGDMVTVPTHIIPLGG